MEMTHFREKNNWLTHKSTLWKSISSKNNYFIFKAVFVLDFLDFLENGVIRKKRLISKFVTANKQSQYCAYVTQYVTK